MNNAWDRARSLAEQHANQGGIFVRLTNNGDKIVGAFCEEPFAREVVWTGERYETHDPAIHTDKRPSLRVMLNFFVPDEDAMKVIEGGTAWFKDVLKVRDKYGLDKWLFEIERHGESGDPKTTYSILPEEKIDDGMRARIAAAEPHDLAAIGNGESEAGDGRDSLRDLYEELLDATAYAVQARLESDSDTERAGSHRIIARALGAVAAVRVLMDEREAGND